MGMAAWHSRRFPVENMKTDELWGEEGASAGQQAGGCLWGEIHLRAYFLLLKIRGPVHSRHAVQSRNWKYMSSESRELSNSHMSA